jgi:rsbT co-antagonist protein RsbR
MSNPGDRSHAMGAEEGLSDPALPPMVSARLALLERALRDAETELQDTRRVVERQNATMQLFERVLESAPLVLWAIDQDGRYTASEGKGLELLGMKPREAVGLSALEMFKDNPAIASALVRALSGEESRLVTTPAPDVYFENWYLPLRGDDGRVRGVAGLALDASERIRSERQAREKLDLIERQSATIRALATPIIQVWDEVVCLPVIGTVDSARTAEMMQGLLETIVREQARYAIVDLTGVKVVDTSTADHLIQLFRAARVLGVEGVLCGIRPAVAQTIVGLGLDLGSVRTTRSLRDALKWCIRTQDHEAAGSRAAPQAPAGPRS